MNHLGIFFWCISNFLFLGNEARLEGQGIRGGNDAEDGEFPYQIALYRFSGGNSEHICGGTIIDERHVVTAAHCVTDGGSGIVDYQLKVVAGISDLKSDADTKVVVDVAQVFTLKEYDPTSTITGDIAVLKLSQDLRIAANLNLRKASLPTKNEIHENIKAIVSGFGFNSVDVITDPKTGFPFERNGYSSGKLRYTEVNVYSFDKCNKIAPTPITLKHICGSAIQRDPEVPEGVCSKDSGGPLIYQNTLIGVISTSPLGCREDSRAAVYTRVSYFIDFIQNAVEGRVTDDMHTYTLNNEE